MVRTTIISPLFNGKFNGDEVNVVDASVTNLTAIEINSTNGTYTNQVEAAIFNGGIFNGDTGIISGTLTANTVNAENLNVDLSLSAPTINGTTTVISPLFNGGKFNGASADIEGLITANSLEAASINGTTTIISPLFNGGKFNGDEANIVGAVTADTLNN